MSGAEYGAPGEIIEMTERVNRNIPEIATYFSGFSSEEQRALGTTLFHETKGDKDKYALERGLRLVGNKEFKAAMVLAEDEQYFTNIDDAAEAIAPESSDEKLQKIIVITHELCSMVVARTLEKGVAGVAGISDSVDLATERLTDLGIDRDALLTQVYQLVAKSFKNRGFDILSSQALTISQRKKWEGSLTPWENQTGESSYPLSEQTLKECDWLSGVYAGKTEALTNIWLATLKHSDAPLTEDFIALHPSRARDGLVLQRYP